MGNLLDRYSAIFPFRNASVTDKHDTEISWNKSEKWWCLTLYGLVKEILP